MVSGVKLAPGNQARVRIVFDYSKSSPLTVDGGSLDFCLLAMEVERRSNTNASLASLSFIDMTGNVARALRFGMPIRILIDGRTRFSGSVATFGTDELGPTSVIVQVQAQGLGRALYSTRFPADVSYAGLASDEAARQGLDTAAAGVLTRNIAVASPSIYLPTPFDVEAETALGTFLERLRDIDGGSFWVDDDHPAASLPVARYEVVENNAVSATITTADLQGDAGDRLLERGVTPPKNDVRIRSKDTGYQAQTFQEERDSWLDLTASTLWVAQRVKAKTDRLSALELLLDRTSAPNLPGDLTIEVFSDATGDVAWEPYASGASGPISVNGNPMVEAMTFTVPSGFGATVRLKRVGLLCTGTNAPGSYTIDLQLRGTTAGVPNTTIYATRVVVPASELTGAQVFLELTVDQDFAAGTVLAVCLKHNSSFGDGNVSVYTDPSGTRPGSRYKSTGSFSVEGAFVLQAGSDLTYQAVYTLPKPGAKLEWSDDNKIGANDVPYNPDWSLTKKWASPKLAVISGAYYWLLLRLPTATALAYWRIGYQSATDPYADGYAWSSNDSGTLWAPLGADLSFRAFWSAEPIDMTVTNCRSRLSAAMTAVQSTIPLEKADDFPDSGTVTIGTEDITHTGRTFVSGTNGAGTLTGCTRGANGTTPATHAIGDLVDGESIRLYGVHSYEESFESLGGLGEAQAIAALLLSKHYHPGVRGTLPFKKYRADVTPFAPVKLVRPVLGFADNLIPSSVKDTLGEDGEIRTTATVGTIQYDAARALESLRRKVT